MQRPDPPAATDGEGMPTEREWLEGLPEDRDAATALAPTAEPWHTHMGRSWTGHHIEDACPCGKAPCGLVDSALIDPACSQHALDRTQTIRQSHAASACPAPHEPDAMGIHSDDGTVWLPKSLYTRSQALTWFAEYAGIPRKDVQVSSEWMVHDPQPDEPEWWRESERGARGAFAVWRCE